MYVNGKMRYVETIPGIEEEGNKGWTQVWYISYTLRIFVNATMYLHLAQLSNIISQQLKKSTSSVLENRISSIH
jgi:hypothetical protein